LRVKLAEANLITEAVRSERDTALSALSGVATAAAGRGGATSVERSRRIQRGGAIDVTPTLSEIESEFEQILSGLRVPSTHDIVKDAPDAIKALFSDTSETCKPCVKEDEPSNKLEALRTELEETKAALEQERQATEEATTQNTADRALAAAEADRLRGELETLKQTTKDASEQAATAAAAALTAAQEAAAANKQKTKEELEAQVAAQTEALEKATAAAAAAAIAAEAALVAAVEEARNAALAEKDAALAEKDAALAEATRQHEGVTQASDAEKGLVAQKVEELERELEALRASAAAAREEAAKASEEALAAAQEAAAANKKKTKEELEAEVAAQNEALTKQTEELRGLKSDHQLELNAKAMECERSIRDNKEALEAKIVSIESKARANKRDAPEKDARILQLQGELRIATNEVERMRRQLTPELYGKQAPVGKPALLIKPENVPYISGNPGYRRARPQPQEPHYGVSLRRIKNSRKTRKNRR